MGYDLTLVELGDEQCFSFFFIHTVDDNKSLPGKFKGGSKASIQILSVYVTHFSKVVKGKRKLWLIFCC